MSPPCCWAALDMYSVLQKADLKLPLQSRGSKTRSFRVLFCGLSSSAHLTFSMFMSKFSFCGHRTSLCGFGCNVLDHMPARRSIINPILASWQKQAFQMFWDLMVSRIITDPVPYFNIEDLVLLYVTLFVFPPKPQKVCCKKALFLSLIIEPRLMTSEWMCEDKPVMMTPFPKQARSCTDSCIWMKCHRTLYIILINVKNVRHHKYNEMNVRVFVLIKSLHKISEVNHYKLSDYTHKLVPISVVNSQNTNKQM